MNRLFGLIALVIWGLAGTGVATARTYDYSGTVTLCTGTCDSFAALAIGSALRGQIKIDSMPDGAFGDADIVNIQLEIFNPGSPQSGPVGDPATDNPLVLDSSSGVLGSNGTAGTTDAAGELNGGQMLFEFLLPPFSSNGAFLVIDLAMGRGQLCLFFATAGCIPGATVAMEFEGTFTGLPGLSVTPTIDFGQVMVNEYTQTVLFMSSGGAVEFGLIEGLEPPFFFGPDSCSLQTVINSCNVTVAFQPATAGVYTDTIIIPSDDLENPLLQVPVMGSTAAELIFSDSFEG